MAVLRNTAVASEVKAAVCHRECWQNNGRCNTGNAHETLTWF